MTSTRSGIRLAIMSGADYHCCSLSPTIRRETDGSRICSGLLRIWVAFITVVILANLAPASAVADLGHASPGVASAIADEPCRPRDGCCGHDHAHCCLTASVAIAASPGVALHVSRRPSASAIAESDVNHSSCGPLSPFHPPKL